MFSYLPSETINYKERFIEAPPAQMFTLNKLQVNTETLTRLAGLMAKGSLDKLLYSAVTLSPDKIALSVVNT